MNITTDSHSTTTHTQRSGGQVAGHGIGWWELISTGLGGPRARPLRTLLTAAGIAIGIASMVTVVGISNSSKAGLLAELDELGTNLLQIQAGDKPTGEPSKLPSESPEMVAALPTVLASASVTNVDARPQRNVYDDTPYGLNTVVTDGEINEALGLTAVQGRLIDAHSQQLPVATLGAVAAERLGIRSIAGGPTVAIGGQEFQVIGIAASHPLHPDLERSVMIGQRYARDSFGLSNNPSAIYVVVAPSQMETTRPILARVANPGAPNEAQVSRPSDALAAQAKVDEGLQTLLLALGATALLVGGVGIANVMIVAVLERRAEVGLRRALGATRSQIAAQFVVESAALSGLGGALGIGLGVVVTVAYSVAQGWRVSVPLLSLTIGISVALALGALAGLYPAVKAARLDPADAVRLS